MLRSCRDSRQGTNLSEISKDHYKERKLQTESHNLLYTKDDFKWELQGIILLTPLLISQIFEVLTTRCFESVTLFKIDAMHMLVQYGAHDAR
jgi:hypothetical protein